MILLLAYLRACRTLLGKFEGRPFNISVRAIARRLANSRGGF